MSYISLEKYTPNQTHILEHVNTHLREYLSYDARVVKVDEHEIT